MVLINATAATEGGALTVLKQLLLNSPSSLTLIVFTSVNFDELPILAQVKYINPNAKSGLKRLYWDNFGLNKWCKANHVKPDLIISMQNTGVKIDGDVKQLIYYHQLIPLYPYSWNLFKKSERNLWLYKNIYPFFVKQHISESTIFVVQFEWIRQKLAKRLALDPQIIHTVNPTASEINYTAVSDIELAGKFNIFYPATYFNYKNHIEIVKLLLNEGANIDKQNKSGDTALILATSSATGCLP